MESSMFESLLNAEKKLLKSCQKGEFLDLTKESELDKKIRGAFLRWLILNNTKHISIDGKNTTLSIDPQGIRFKGARIIGQFNVSFCETKLPFFFYNSHFDKEINLSDAKIRFLSLRGCTVPSIDAQRLICEGSVFLNKGFKATGKVNFIAAQIKGSLACGDGTFTNKNSDALNCNRATIQGSVFLDDTFQALGKVNFIGAHIGSSFICSNGKFFNKNGDALNSDKAIIQGSVFLNEQFKAIGKVNFSSAHIGSSFTCNNGKFIDKNGNALNCNSAKIQGNFILKNDFYAFGKVNLAAASMSTLSLANTIIKGDLDLKSAKINTINEDELFFQNKGFGDLSLDGLVYNHLNGENLDANNRIAWLRKMPKFQPQPYKHLAKVLRTMGHHKDADAIMIEYNTILTHQTKEDISPLPKNFITALMLFMQTWCVFFIRKIYGKTAGYGYRPWNVFITMLCVWLLCGAFYGAVAKVAVFSPSDPLIFQKKAFYECIVNENGTPIVDIFSWGDYNSSNNNWTANKNLEGEYTTFSPWWYSLDIILPIVDLQMDKDWGVFIPSEGLTLNHVTRWVIWFEILFGWIYSLILVAILSGLAKNEKD